MPKPTYDVIVVGIGGMGSAACYHLASRGQKVLGLERFDIPHTMGSSHGLTRIIRLAYHESPAYVPLVRRAMALWRETGDRFGEQLLFTTGSLDAGPDGGDFFAGSLTAVKEHDLPHELLTAAEINARFPGFNLPATHRGLFQPDGGFVASERGIIAHVMLAQAAGAEICAREGRALGAGRRRRGSRHHQPRDLRGGAVDPFRRCLDCRFRAGPDADRRA